MIATNEAKKCECWKEAIKHISVDIDFIGEFHYSTYSYDTDYPELEDTGFDVSDLEELEMFMAKLIPEKEYLKLEKIGELEEWNQWFY